MYSLSDVVCYSLYVTLCAIFSELETLFFIYHEKGSIWKIVFLIPLLLGFYDYSVLFLFQSIIVLFLLIYFLLKLFKKRNICLIGAFSCDKNYWVS